MSRSTVFTAMAQIAHPVEVELEVVEPEPEEQKEDEEVDEQ